MLDHDPDRADVMTLEAFDAADQRVIEAELSDGPGWCLDLADALDRRDEVRPAR